MSEVEIPIDEFKEKAEKALQDMEIRFQELMEETQKMEKICECYATLNKTLNDLMEKSLITFKAVNVSLESMTLLNYRTRRKELLKLTKEIMDASNNREAK